jgi:glycogen debranching enzyme
MPPSFTCVIKVKTRTYVKEAIQRLNQMDEDPRIPVMFDRTPSSGLNHVLFRCEPEEKDISAGKRGPYGFQEYGCLSYSGIASLMHMIKKVKLYKDLGCEMFENIRQGDWLLDYTVSRITEYCQAEDIGLDIYGQFLQEYANLIKKLPSYLKPKYLS